jgi:hypothetical protein
MNEPYAVLRMMEAYISLQQVAVTLPPEAQAALDEARAALNRAVHIASDPNAWVRPHLPARRGADA